jgi:FkbM family methyltransferase
MLAIAPKGKHHAFEALPHLVAQLQRDFPSAVIHGQAVSDKSGTAEFQHVENDPAYSGLRRRIYDRPDPKIVPITVPVTTLDGAIPPELQIALIKLDIEGGEYHALKGAANLIRRCRPYIAFEANQNSTGQYDVTADGMYDLLFAMGYDLSTLKRWRNGKGPISKSAFAHNWIHGPDFFWLAVPRSAS